MNEKFIIEETTRVNISDFREENIDAENKLTGASDYYSAVDSGVADDGITADDGMGGKDERFLPSKIDNLDIERQYRQLMFMHEAAIEQVTSRLNILKGEFQFSNDRNPISSVSSRIKSKESIIYKMQKKGLPFTFSALVAGVRDIAGVRVICPFIQDVYDVARMLVRQPDIEVAEVKDYIREPKENGYRSLHLIVNVNVHFSNTARKVPVEIQIRTIAMDFWASTEHQLRYKKDKEFSEKDQAKLKHCADLMAEADKEIQSLAGDFDLEQW